jgi:hypothetical protein
MEILEHRDTWYEDFQNGWLAYYQQTGELDWKQYQPARNKTAPAGPAVDLSRSRLLFITSAGGYLPATQHPFDTDNQLGDYTIRTFPTTTQFAELSYAHTRYNHTGVDADAQVLLPLRHLEDLVAAGSIGELAPTVISFMGYQPDVTRVVDELIPAILEAAQTQQPDAALLVPS